MQSGNSLSRARGIVAGMLFLAFTAWPVGGTLAAVTGELVVADSARVLRCLASTRWPIS
jgi:hypothetical protein